MIQDILPHIFDNQAKEQSMQENDIIFCFRENQVLLKNELGIYHVQDLRKDEDRSNLKYCFSIDDIQVFSVDSISYLEGKWHPVSVCRSFQPAYMGFVLITAYQLWLWNSDHHYCGRCGSVMKNSDTERAKICEKCNHIIYPTLSPAIIVGIIDRHRILLAKNLHSHTGNYALIAGYCEIGETLEATLKREVMEEVGLKVKNIRYYKSQPWGLSSSLLVGFFADLDGSDKITLQHSELSEASWFTRDELQKKEVLDSLTSEMIDAFRRNKIECSE